MEKADVSAMGVAARRPPEQSEPVARCLLSIKKLIKKNVFFPFLLKDLIM